MTHITEEELAELIAALPSAPPAWVETAVQLPRARATIEQLVAEAMADQDRRKAVLSDLEAALSGAGVQPRPHLVEDLRARLGVSAQ